MKIPSRGRGLGPGSLLGTDRIVVRVMAGVTDNLESWASKCSGSRGANEVMEGPRWTGPESMELRLYSWQTSEVGRPL